MENSNIEAAKPKKKSLIVRHPVPVSIVLFFLIQTAGGTIGEFIVSVMAGLRAPTQGTPDYYYFLGLVSIPVIIATIIALLILKKRIYKTFGINFKNAGPAFFLSSIMLLELVAGTIYFVIAKYTFNFDLGFKMVLGSFLVALSAGFVEEAAFRGIIISGIAKKYEASEKIIVKAMLWGSVVFGLVHLSNAFMYDPVFVIFQTVHAIALGMIFCAAYLRTGNLLVPMFFHFLFDFVTFVLYGFVGLDSFAETSTYDMISTIVASAVFIAAALFFVRKSKHEEILKIWSER